MDKQVVSKQRVADHGEVLTGRREVNAMLDLVKSETERIDSRFLEPSCGTGNFLAVRGSSFDIPRKIWMSASVKAAVSIAIKSDAVCQIRR